VINEFKVGEYYACDKGVYEVVRISSKSIWLRQTRRKLIIRRKVRGDGYALLGESVLKPLDLVS
jgi:hypothetical protein